MKKIFEDLFTTNEQVAFLLVVLNVLLGGLTLITLIQEVMCGNFLWGSLQFGMMSLCLIALDYLLRGLFY